MKELINFILIILGINFICMPLWIILWYVKKNRGDKNGRNNLL